LLAPLAVRMAIPAVGALMPQSAATLSADIAPALAPLGWVSAGFAAFALLVVLLAVLRARLLSGRMVGEAGTWDCGYARPTARMQYTASSFAQPLVGVFSGLVGTQKKERRPEGIFPKAASFASDTPDPLRRRLYDPLFTQTLALLSHLRRAQHGRVQVYVLYIALTLIALLAFSLGQ